MITLHYRKMESSLIILETVHVTDKIKISGFQLHDTLIHYTLLQVNRFAFLNVITSCVQINFNISL